MKGGTEKPFPDPYAQYGAQAVKYNCGKLDDQGFRAEKFHGDTLDQNSKSSILAEDLLENKFALSHQTGGPQHDPVMMRIDAETAEKAEPEKRCRKEQQVPEELAPEKISFIG